jgi:peroxiredoxin
LNERLEAFAQETGQLNPAFHAAVDRFVSRLRNADAGAATPQVGEAMPGFLLPDHAGHLVNLEDLLERGPVALTLHRGHWCPYCRISITALAQAHQGIAETGGQVVAIVPDLQQFAEEFQAEAHASFPVLSDVDNGYAAALNLVVWMGEEMTGLVRKFGIDLPSYQGNESWTFPIPATFVIGGDGRIKARFVDPDYRKRMPIETLLDALRKAS